MTKSVTQAVEELIRATVHLSDADMGREWEWGVYDEEGLRFALLMTHHELRDLAVQLASRARTQPTQAQRILAQYQQTYRDLTGVLAGVRTEDLDRAPAEGEWPVRETLAHALGAEHGFLAVNRFALVHHRAGKHDEPPEEEWPEFRRDYAAPKDAVDGTIEKIRNSFFAIHWRVLSELGDVTDAELEQDAWFWDGAMPIRFRLHRFEEHLRQHTIQLDKTLAVIAPPTEAHRLVRNIYNALADVESSDEPAEDLRAKTAVTIAERAATIAT
ncbi:MAG TPA: DinB family protein [Candidatus Limnocylindria bacterium]|nr:DinB family protein [Candidatus Limnocylindria bacterium]